MVDRDTTDPVGWDDVAGADEAKEELKEVVEFLRDRKKFEKLGARVPKGVLLYGPPGTGKTLLAKAAANESGANFYSSSASAFVEMFAGLGAARIRKLFEEARKNAPAIIFIDELDAVGTARSGGGHNREHDQTLNQLLVELDGFGGADEVVIMGASNRLAGSRPRSPASGPLRPPGQRRAARSPRPRGDPRRPHALEAPRRRCRHPDHRPPHRRPHRRRPRQHRERGSDLRGAQRPAVHPPAGLRGSDGAGAHRPPEAPRRDREGEADPRLPRGRPRARRLSDGRRDAGAEGDHRRPRRRARPRLLPSRRGSLPAHEGRAARRDEGRARRPRRRGDRLRPGHERRRQRPREGHRRSPARWSSSSACPMSRPRGRCAPTTTRCRRRPSGCATASRPASPITPTRRRCACSASTASRSTGSRTGCSRRRRSTGTSSSR